MTAIFRQWAWTRRRHAGSLADLLPSTLAVLLLALTVAWHLRPAPDEAALSPPPSNAGTARTHPEKSFDPAILASWHPFGISDAPIAATAPQPAGETGLELTLKGVYFSSGDKQSGYAIIAKPVGGERAYAIGDAVADGATLYRVEKHRVILKHRDRLETLSLPRPEANGSSGSGTAENTHKAQGNGVEISAPTR